MILVTKRISLVNYQDSITVIPLGDIQWNGSPEHTALGALNDTITKGVAANAFYVGMGDYVDTFSPSNRQRLRGAALYDTATEFIEDANKKLTDSVYDIALGRTKGRWLGLLEGHHFAEFSHGETTDMYLSRKLEAPFLGTSALIRLLIDIQGHRLSAVLWVHHGSGGGGKAGSPLSRIEGLAPYWGGVDVFMMGHSTKGPVVGIDQIHPVWGGRGGAKLDHRKVLFVSTGSFSKSYELRERGGYAEQRMLNPSLIGVPTLKFKPRRLRERGKDHIHLDISVEI